MPLAAARRIGPILKALARAYPGARCSLTYRTPLELLIATILSAQCTDTLVNKVTPALFKKYRTAAAFARASLPQLQRDIARVNFYRNKAKSIQGACRLIVARFQGRVPSRMEDLLTLPGVARKTANVVMGNAYGKAVGVVVDTHVMRLSSRLALTAQTDRDKIEQELMRLIPPARWTRFSHEMIQHGRQVCRAQAPQCGRCPIGQRWCPAYRADVSPAADAARRARANRRTSGRP